MRSSHSIEREYLEKRRNPYMDAKEALAYEAALREAKRREKARLHQDHYNRVRSILDAQPGELSK